ncbi:Rdx family-domain-containing protein [Lactarius akahatsu]|uniref:Rdx family-domain-containing protein n=1 Tax=Lactarius akahatsu TaxID=416441 RepID=A0AAD4LU62_9AGAM|nr:Rdx family-domain-containing protein [Lactarius akahatsu]
MASSNVQTDGTQLPTDEPLYDPMNPSTFVAPSPSTPYSVIIEFCDRCRWLHRATWTSTELFLTFPPPTIRSITIIPLNSEDTAGRFRVWLTVDEGSSPILMWDRKVEGNFPELKVLKQRIRDRIQPDRSLGHSDQCKK